MHKGKDMKTKNNTDRDDAIVILIFGAMCYGIWKSFGEIIQKIILGFFS